MFYGYMHEGMSQGGMDLYYGIGRAAITALRAAHVLGRIPPMPTIDDIDLDLLDRADSVQEIIKLMPSSENV